MKIVADKDIPYVEECFSNIGEVEAIAADRIWPPVVSDADVLVVRAVTLVTPRLLEGSKVKFVAAATSGTDHIDRRYLQRQNIGLASAPGANANSVAEYVIAALLSLGRRKGTRLAGRSIGIIGVGNIGSRIARKAKALEMKTYLNDPPLQEQTGASRYQPIEDLCQCDVITVHTPLTRGGKHPTYQLCNADFFNSMKDGAFFINTSRGAVVDSAALKRIIGNGKLGGIVLDVWENEPEIDTGLVAITDLATPHIAGHALDGRIRLMMTVFAATCRFFGIESNVTLEKLLPRTENREIQVDDRTLGIEKNLYRVVQTAYPIDRDDTDLRRILILPKSECGEYFNRLRSEYPIRREFNTRRVGLYNFNNELRAKLAGLGFQVGAP